MSRSKRKLRTLFVLPSLQGGGAEKVTLQVARLLAHSCRFEPSVLVLKKQGELLQNLPNDIPVSFAHHTPGSLKFHGAKVLSRCVAHAQRSDIVIGAVELTATYFAATSAKLAKVPCVGWVHTALQHFLSTNGRSPVHRVLAPAVYNSIRNVVVPTPGAKDEFLRLARRAEVTIIPNPIDRCEIETGAALLPPEWLPEGEFIVSVGRLDRQKGFDILLRALALLQQTTSCPLPPLVILGEGPERRSLEALIHSLGLCDKVFLPGFVNPHSIVNRARLAVFASRFEGFGLSIAEALALGTPVVSSDAPWGPRSILCDGKLGTLVPTEDPAALAEAIAEALRAPPPVNPTSEIYHRFDPERLSAAWSDHLEQLAA